MPLAQPSRLAQCPECGWDTAQPASAARPASLWWRRLVVVAWLATIVGAATTFLGRGSTTRGISFGSAFPRVALPAVSLAEVREIAGGGAQAGAGLVSRVLQATSPFRPDITENWSVEVGFVGSGAQRTEWRSFGWPTEWVGRARYPVYDDAVR